MKMSNEPTSEQGIPLMDLNEEIQRARQKWEYRGSCRPAFAQAPLAGQESVWDYPRPPTIEAVSAHLKVLYNGQLIASSDQAVRVLETAGAPTYYFSPQDVKDSQLTFSDTTAICEWKGLAQAIEIDGNIYSCIS
jgi:hypothetical protein